MTATTQQQQRRGVLHTPCKRFSPFTQPNGGNTMRIQFSKLAQVTAIGLACAFKRNKTVQQQTENNKP